jgi:uncharacterized protein YukE
MVHVPHKNPYAATWAEAERRINEQIRAIHAIGVDVDQSRRGLHWQGASEQRFQARARDRHDELQQHNDALRYLLQLVQLAATMKPAAAQAGAA